MPIQPGSDPALAERLRAAVVSIDEGRWPDAVSKAAADLTDGDYEAAVSLLCFFTTGGREQAVQFADSAAPEAPSTDHLRALSATLLYLRHRTEALEAARRAVSAEPEDRRGLFLLSRAAAECRVREEATSAAERLVQNAPAWPPAHDALAHAYEIQERLSEARPAAERAVQLAPGLPFAWERLGQIAGKQGDAARALAAHWASAQLAPGWEPFRENVVDALARFELKESRPKLPVAVALVLAVCALLFFLGRQAFVMIGLPAGLASWLAVPPLLMIAPALLAQFRRVLLARLHPEIRDFAEKARRDLGQESATSQLGRTILKLAAFGAYYALVFSLQYRMDPASFKIVAIFYTLITLLGWLRFRFTKPDTYFSIRER